MYTQGQNHITALSRAVYFLLAGVLALCIDAALRNIDTFPVLLVYEFNVNSQVVLMFVRDALLSKWVWLEVWLQVMYLDNYSFLYLLVSSLTFLAT